ncbi:MAG: LarC family nickel insertion protein [Candidatus Rifleibacteriota bacterium]
MNILYWDCFSGIAGNMAVASLIDLGADRKKLEKAVASIPFEEGKVELIFEEKLNMGIRGTYFNTLEDHVMHATPDKNDSQHSHTHKHSHEHSQNHSHGDHHHHHHGPHRGLPEIRALLEKADISDNAREIALKCFSELAAAEAEIHGKSIDEVHFHEVGARDSIVDMVGVAVCFDDLNIGEIKISPVHLGSGMVNCAHGKIPVPAPATAVLLKGFPVVIDTDVPFELTTPTGAAILRGMKAEPVGPGEFVYEAVGHGLGSFNTGRPNFLRAFLKKGSQDLKKKRISSLS